ncbi:initiation-control protein [Ligilactobacillus hayakitensis DSM 18933 = JCM 14209]|uniref:Replication initiation control protein YabA n=1 Tax=Ligilactobacillus hayakitensis DSM 18933 = JCM 14209 TaxID=1423755 RepID=A0A0R1WV90_9LACO|nr:DNA replication initiation control protein YabA [Ligilactobacillus hayakitensis]KRM18316.1 initiation-control protein [Ligilactobacillus hayakitensis DSM 18933 = JCM 14209]
MDKRELFNSFENLTDKTKNMVTQIAELETAVNQILEKNVELEIENQHLRARLKELEPKSKNTKMGTGLSKSRKNLEKLYEEGFHVCNEEDMFGTRRFNDEPCVFCQDVIYGDRH